jgi:hypothetical protein
LWIGAPVAIAVLLSACTATSANAEGAATPYGAILPPTAAVLSGGAAPYWRPTIADVAAAEANLGPYLAQANLPPYARSTPKRLSGYTRQYVGATQGGRRVLIINAFCDDRRNHPSWRQELVMVLDGGDCFFRAVFDVRLKRFVGVEVNGVG